jgi:hypothetical protein
MAWNHWVTAGARGKGGQYPLQAIHSLVWDWFMAQFDGDKGNDQYAPHTNKNLDITGKLE